MDYQITKSDVLSLADQASNFYTRNKVASLSAAVVDAIAERPLNIDQVERVVQATNQATWAKLSAQKPPQCVRFDPARVEDVTSTRLSNEQGVEKIAHVCEAPAVRAKTASRTTPFTARLEGPPMKRLEERLFAAMGQQMSKTAAAEMEAEASSDPYAITPAATSDWTRIYDKVAAARAGVDDRINTCTAEFLTACDQLTKAASDLRVTGVTGSEIQRAVESLAPDQELATAAWAIIEKTASVTSTDFTDFIAHGDDLGRATIWDRPEMKKTASAPRDFNPQHPLIVALTKMGELRTHSQVLHGARESLLEEERQACAFARQNEGVPDHV